MKAKNNTPADARGALLLGYVLLLAGARCEAQGNLVPNHSFEEADTCWPYSGFYYPHEGPDHWFSGGHSPDYFQGPNCAAYGSDISAPLNHLGFQYAQHGVAYTGVVTYQHPDPWREFLVVQLEVPLVEGETYFASFYANAAWGGTAPFPIARLASSNVGMRFTMEPNQWEWNDPLPVTANYAQVHYAQILSDTAAWTLVSGSFVADSAYQYLMIGNHFSNALTDTVPFEPTISLPVAYTFIDNVCVSNAPDGCPLWNSVGMQGEPAMVLYPNPAQTGLFVSGVPDGTWAQVRDAVGRNVWQGSAEQGTWQLDVSAWARGNYVLRIKSGSLVRSFKFVLIE